jgi:phage-related protein
MDETPLKEVVWVGPTRKELKEFPRPVQRAVGLALYAVQLGETPPDAKPLKGFGGGRSLRDQGLRAACVSEEIETRHRHAAEGNRFDPRPA